VVQQDIDFESVFHPGSGAKVAILRHSVADNCSAIFRLEEKGPPKRMARILLVCPAGPPCENRVHLPAFGVACMVRKRLTLDKRLGCSVTRLSAFFEAKNACRLLALRA
jgi:hypothetical protein